MELIEERNPSIRDDSQVAEVTLHLKGATLRAREASEDMNHSVNLVAEDIARQVKRHRDKRRGRRGRAGKASSARQSSARRGPARGREPADRPSLPGSA